MVGLFLMSEAPLNLAYLTSSEPFYLKAGLISASSKVGRLYKSQGQKYKSQGRILDLAFR